MNKKELASEKMKSHLINKTIELLGNNGPTQFSAAILSKEAGVSKGALYHHFDSLEVLKLAALQTLIDTFLNVDENSNAKATTLEEYLLAIGDEIFDLMEQEPVKMKALMTFIQYAIFDDAFQKKVKALFSCSLAQHTQVVRDLFPGLSDEQVTQAVQIVDAYSAGSMIHWYLVCTPEQCRANWKRFCGMFLKSINPEVA